MTQAEQARPLAESEGPWLVALGASAGGLEALQRFFSRLTPPTQAAFVVIQHLSPDHRSMMSELLARYRVAGFNTYGEQHSGMHVNQTFVGMALMPPEPG